MGNGEMGSRSSARPRRPARRRGAALVVAVVATVPLAACQALYEGAVGVTVDTTGAVVLLLAPCRGQEVGGGVDRVALRELPKTGGGDVLLRDPRVTSPLRSGGEPIELELDIEVALEQDTSYLVLASTPGLINSANLDEVRFSTRSLAALHPDDVVVGAPGRLVSRADFAAQACDNVV